MNCGHRQHTNMCSALSSVILCLLFHVHLHLAHASDIRHYASTPPSLNGSLDKANTDNENGKRIMVDEYTQELFSKYATNENAMTLGEFEAFLCNLGLVSGNDCTGSTGHIHPHSHEHSSHSSEHMDSHSDNHDLHDHESTEDHVHESPSNVEDNVNVDSNTLSSSNSDHDHVHMLAKRAVKNFPPLTDHNPHTLKNLFININNQHFNQPQSGRNVISTLYDRSVKKLAIDSRAKRDTALKQRRMTRETHDGHDDVNQSPLNQCLSGQDLVARAASENETTLSPAGFQSLFPAIIYQLDSRVCQDTHQETHEHADRPFWRLPLSVWLYAIAAITVISLVGLLSVALIPLTSKVIYNHLLQFLVALAVGTLTGDACLHLLPHALTGDNHSHADGSSHGAEEHSHEGVFKGLVALMGIYFFFVIEQSMKLYSGRKHRLNKERRALDKEKRQGLLGDKDKSDARDPGVTFVAAVKGPPNPCNQTLMIVHKDVKELAQDAHDDTHVDCDVSITAGSRGGHSHSHSHSKLPRSVAAVAWMVVMGDGIHNFGDGLAIGAAFASNISVGLSTTVAVFCHELPHEIGDFAVLLRAGMSAKQAIVYNIASSVLAVLGMLIGLLVGNISSASLWIFALIGGMFIYVALVDMMPELTKVDPQVGETPLLHLVLQNAGMLLGFAIMLLIALFENDIQVPGSW